MTLPASPSAVMGQRSPNGHAPSPSLRSGIGAIGKEEEAGAIGKSWSDREGRRSRFLFPYCPNGVKGA